jgi:hypothetical protein
MWVRLISPGEVKVLCRMAEIAAERLDDKSLTDYLFFLASSTTGFSNKESAQIILDHIKGFQRSHGCSKMDGLKKQTFDSNMETFNSNMEKLRAVAEGTQ